MSEASASAEAESNGAEERIDPGHSCLVPRSDKRPNSIDVSRTRSTGSVPSSGVGRYVVRDQSVISLFDHEGSTPANAIRERRRAARAIRRVSRRLSQRALAAAVSSGRTALLTSPAGTAFNQADDHDQRKLFTNMMSLAMPSSCG
jgi:hypothetical protein